MEKKDKKKKKTYTNFHQSCSSQEIFLEILKTSRHKELAFLWRDVFRFLTAF
jgi:hypothetical protein